MWEALVHFLDMNKAKIHWVALFIVFGKIDAPSHRSQICFIYSYSNKRMDNPTHLIC